MFIPSKNSANVNFSSPYRLFPQILRNYSANPIGNGLWQKVRGISEQAAEKATSTVTVAKASLGEAATVAKEAATVAKEAAANATASVDSKRMVLVEAKNAIAGTYKWGKAALIICGIFFTTDFVLKSTASICKSTLEIQGHYQAYQDKSKIKN